MMPSCRVSYLDIRGDFRPMTGRNQPDFRQFIFGMLVACGTSVLAILAMIAYIFYEELGRRSGTLIAWLCGALAALGTGAYGIRRTESRDELWDVLHCSMCSYDLTGNTTGFCPECGTPCYEHPQERDEG
jgi:hypothetical protein